MSITRAWSSEDGMVLLYLEEAFGETYLILNDNGDCSEIHKQGIDLTKAAHGLFVKFEKRYITLVEVKVHPLGETIQISVVQNGREKTFGCRVVHTFVNRGGNPRGIEQQLIATHTIERSGEVQLEDQMPMLLLNNAHLVGQVQGWKLRITDEDV